MQINNANRLGLIMNLMNRLIIGSMIKKIEALINMYSANFNWAYKNKVKYNPLNLIIRFNWLKGEIMKEYFKLHHNGVWCFFKKNS